MERLTKQLIVPDTGEVLAYMCKVGITDAKIRTKLGRYEDLEEQGLLLRLPCKVGDTVYRILPNAEYIMDCRVEEFVFSDKVYVIVREALFNTRRGIPYCEKGRTLFLTKEEAEAALEKMKGEES